MDHPRRGPSWIEDPSGSLVGLARPRTGAVDAVCLPGARLIALVLCLGRISSAGGRISALQAVGAWPLGWLLLCPLALGFASAAADRALRILRTPWGSPARQAGRRAVALAQCLLMTVLFAVTAQVVLNGAPHR